MNAVRESRKTPMPPDFPELAPTMTAAELAARYGCCEPVIRRWSREGNVDYKNRVQRLPPPDDFAQVAPLHTCNELRRIYGCSWDTIARWAREANVTVKRVRPHYVKHDPAAEIALCLTCPFARCRPAHCRRIGRA